MMNQFQAYLKLFEMSWHETLKLCLDLHRDHYTVEPTNLKTYSKKELDGWFICHYSFDPVQQTWVTK